jgi:hypothetical protein
MINSYALYLRSLTGNAARSVVAVFSAAEIRRCVDR